MSAGLDIESLRQQLTDMLRANLLLAELSDEQINQLSGRAVFEEYQSGEKIFSQGRPANHFCFIINGQVRIIDANRQPPYVLAYMHHDQFFGERALLFDIPREFTAEVMADTVVAKFDRSTWHWLTSNAPQISDGFKDLEHSYDELSHIEFPGRQPDEVVVRRDKRHILAFVATLPAPLILMILGLGISILLFQLAISPVFAQILTVLSILLGVLLIIYNYADWHNDDFIVTSDRVIHIERTIIYGENREESPLTAIQDVSVDIPNFFTRLFGYYNVTIKTAGAGNIIFDGLKNGQEIKNVIFDQREQAQERVEASDMTAIRKSLVDRMGWDDAVAIEESVRFVRAEEPKKPSNPILSRLKHARMPPAVNYAIPRVKEYVPDKNMIIWRKHYFILLQLAILPVIALFTIFYLILASLLGLFPFIGPGNFFITFVLIVLWIVNWVWYFYQYDTWRKDIYMVTRTSISDIHGSPFGLGKEESREGTFDNIQNTTYVSPNIFTKILNMGDVVIETAGTADTFTFKQVYNYKEVQQEVSKRLLAFKEGERKKTRDAEERRYIRWLGEYHDLAEKSGQLQPADPMNKDP